MWNEPISPGAHQEIDRFPDVTFPPLCITLAVEQYYVWRNVPPVLCRSPRPFSAAVSRYQHGGLFMRRTAFARQCFLPPTWTAPPFIDVALSLGGLLFWRTQISSSFRYQRCTPDMRTCRCTSDMHTCRYMTHTQMLASCTNANHIFFMYSCAVFFIIRVEGQRKRGSR